MDEKELKQRTKRFSLRVIKLVGALPKTVEGRAIGNQLIRSGTAVGANYRAACRGRSKAEFIARLGVVEEEADESAFWMELLVEGRVDEKGTGRAAARGSQRASGDHYRLPQDSRKGQGR